MADQDRDRSRRRNRRGRPGVLPLNQGSSSFGRFSTLKLNQPGGSFGAGRPAGGGGIAAALAGAPGLQHAPSVVGTPEIGPPPVPQGPPINPGQQPVSGGLPAPSFPTQPGITPGDLGPAPTQSVMPPLSSFPGFTPPTVQQPFDPRKVRFF